jgi:phage terminase large subunit
MLKVHVVFDLGWNDAMAISLVQKHTSSCASSSTSSSRTRRSTTTRPAEERKPINWGNVYLPHDGRHKDYKTGKSAKKS